MNKEQKINLLRCISGVLMLAVLIILSSLSSILDNTIVKLICFIAVYLFIGYDILIKAFKNILKGEIFDENFLMIIASIGAFAVGEYPESIAVVLFFQVGELFESIAVAKSRRSISELMDLRPDYANLEVNGKVTQVDPETIEIGSVILVKPGEKVPIDGVVIDGETFFDTAALTGESVPCSGRAGDDVLSGSVNTSGTVRIRTTKLFGDSAAAKILDLVEHAAAKKTRAESFITKFARIYTPCVVIAALLLAVVPPMFGAGEYVEWIKRALLFLVVSCPCALVISVPLTFFAGIGGASKAGILIKGSNYFEALSKTDMVVFDKTGTLTQGNFEVTDIIANGVEKSELLECAAYAEGYSDHPIAIGIKKAYGEIDLSRVSEAKEIAGKGVCVRLDGQTVHAGNLALIQSIGIMPEKCDIYGTVVYVARNNKYIGCIVISDVVKKDAKTAVSDLKQIGVKSLMLTGDNKETAAYVAGEIGIKKYYAGLLPGDKMEHIEKFKKQNSGTLAFVGDGINDAPALTCADTGIAMGGVGSDAATEAADVVIMRDEPTKVAAAIRIARRTMGIARQNIVFALGIKFAVMILGALGYANMWWAVFADVGVSVIAILNAMRAVKTK